MNAMPDAPAGTTPVLRPLVVDLDHTLVKTDTLVESLIQLFFSAPGRFLAVLASALKGRAAFKAAIAKNIALDGAALPYDPAVLDLIKARRADGGSVHLVSAAHQSIVTAVSEEKAGLFDTAVGTDGSVNLKGDNKAKFLIGRFGRDFAYLGDSKADIHVWSVAAEALIVARGGGVVDLARRKGVTPSTVIPRPGASAKDWIRALRVHQWTKNGVILLPLILSQQALIPAQLAKAVMAFILFGLVASGTYLINDLSDLAADRAHPKKCNRPVPAGRIPVTHAAVAACALLLFGLGTAWATSPPLFMALICYVGLTLAYSFVLKRKALIDLLVIGTLFTIRVGAGMACIGQPLSVWLCAFTVMLFTSLASAKRHAEVIRAGWTGKPLAGRDYLPEDAPVTVSIGISTAATACLLMLLYMQFEASRTGLYHHPTRLFLIPGVLAAWLLRIWSRAQRGNLDHDPVVFALSDKISWAHAAAIVALWFSAVSKF